MGAEEARGEHDLALNKSAREIGAVLAGICHDKFQGEADSLKIRIQALEIPAENQAAFGPQVGLQFAGITRLSAKELDIGWTKKAQHRAVAIQG